MVTPRFKKENFIYSLNHCCIQNRLGYSGSILGHCGSQKCYDPDDWSNTMLSYMNTLSGGAFSNATLFAMGITPYINSSIIIQLLCVAIPPLERLAREGEAGRRKISAITRYVTVGLGIIQGTAYYFYLLNSKGNTLQQRF